MTALQWVIVHVSHSNCTWKIDFKGCSIGDEGVEMLVQGAVEEETHTLYRRNLRVGMRFNFITSEGGLPKQLKNRLEMLSLNHNDLDPICCEHFVHLIPDMPHLKELYLSGIHNIDEGGTVSLIASLTVHNSLEKLELYNTRWWGMTLGLSCCTKLD